MAPDVKTIDRVLIDAAAQRPDAEAIIFPHLRLTTSGVLDGALDVARGLYALGVRRGDHVGILMPNCPDIVGAFFGCQLLGAIVVPINARYQGPELAYVVENADLRVLLTSDVVADAVDYAERLHRAIPELESITDPQHLDLAAFPRLTSIVMFGESSPAGMVGPGRFRGLAALITDDLGAGSGAALSDVAIMLFTSGTTSRPKACMLSHRAVVRTWLETAKRFGLRRGDTFWNPCPMFHLSGIGPMIFTLALGCPLVTLTHFNADTALSQIRDEQADFIYPAFPLLTMAVFKHRDFAAERFSFVRAMLNIGPPDTLRMIQASLPTAVNSNCFGQTELSGISAFTDPSDSLEQRTETNGRPLDGIEMRIVDPETAAVLPPGEIGEIQARGYQAFDGYYQDPELTARTITADGFVRTGDLGFLHADGRLTYVGRLKDMLKVGGENVAATEIEAHLSLHPAVKLVQVVGKPDERYQEVPVAFVELAAGHTATEQELIDHTRGQLASFKVPRAVHFVTEWPMSATKIQKFRLLDLLEGGGLHGE